jgi:hypothetical protein
MTAIITAEQFPTVLADLILNKSRSPEKENGNPYFVRQLSTSPNLTVFIAAPQRPH